MSDSMVHRNAMLQIACICVGELYPDLYVRKLHAMLRRNVGEPFSLACFTDRERRVPAEIEQIDCSGWGMSRSGMRPTVSKLRLFDPELWDRSEFFYFDLSLVILRDLRPVMELARGAREDLLIVSDWTYPSYNSCFMRIRRSESLGSVYREFREGRTYEQRVRGDQDFLHSSIRSNGLESLVRVWPDEFALSYKRLRELHATDPEQARRRFGDALILKFHGKPRQHHLVNGWRRFLLTVRDPGHWGTGFHSYLRNEVAAAWR